VSGIYMVMPWKEASHIQLGIGKYRGILILSKSFDSF